MQAENSVIAGDKVSSATFTASMEYPFDETARSRPLRLQPIAERPVYDWPNGKRLAVYVAVNVEHFAFANGIGHLISVENQTPDQRGHAWREYGNRVGIWRMLDLLGELELPACHLINSSIFEYAPSIPKALMARGDEFIGHGRTNAERQGQMWEDDEAELLRTVRDTIAEHTGKRPRGWMRPCISDSS